MRTERLTRGAALCIAACLSFGMLSGFTNGAVLRDAGRSPLKTVTLFDMPFIENTVRNWIAASIE